MSTLNKILQKHQQSITPESRIVSFRETSLALNEIEQKVSSLKSLALESHNTGSVLGMFTKTQAVSLRGFIILIFASLVFMTIYLKAIKSDFVVRKAPLKITPAPQTNIQYHFQEKSRPKLNQITKIMIITLISGGIGSVGASLAIKSTSIPPKGPSPINTSTKVLGSSTEASVKEFPYQVNLIPPKVGTIPVRNSPSITSPQIRSLNESKSVSVFKKVDQWVMIMSQEDSSQNSGWWINDFYIEKN
ncbi:TPA: hypothetical protein DIU27_04580 [Candidatus Collierbacteria bacterium]|nr:hypothetical protein [Candidatus Collierbacteria bacterium]